MATQLFPGKSQVPDSFVSPDHPLYNPDVKKYSFDPQAAAQMLQDVGWVDSDNNPSTPRVASGVAGVADGTPFEFDYLVPAEGEKPQAAQILKDSLAQCGIRVNVRTESTDQLFAPGPDSPIFGREFAMAQFAWVTSLQPPCDLYTSGQIPGPYPDYPQGWGGANVSGYSNPEYDRLFQQMKDMANGPERQAIIDRMVAIVRRDAPWVFGFHPKNFSLQHSWLKNVKPNLMANNSLKYLRIDAAAREAARVRWNRPDWRGPIVAVLIMVLGVRIPVCDITYQTDGGLFYWAGGLPAILHQDRAAVTGLIEPRPVEEGCVR